MTQKSCMETWTLADGTKLNIRPISPADAELEQAFVRGLSRQSRYYRFHNAIKELSPKQLAALTHPDSENAAALIVVRESGGTEEEIAVARYVICPDRKSCEFAIVVADAWQKHGLGTRLLQALIAHAQARGLSRIYDAVFASNLAMRNLAARMGFVESTCADDPALIVIAKSLA